MALLNRLFVFFVFVLVIVLYVNCQGYSSTYRKQEDNGHYSFGYNIKDKKGSTNFRKEKGDGWGHVSGSYGLSNAKDGRMRVVHYKADKKGFRAVIKTNEPGTSNEDSANAIYNGVDDSWSKSHVESGSPGGWHSEKKSDDHWGKKEDHWGGEKKIKHKESHGWEEKHPNHW